VRPAALLLLAAALPVLAQEKKKDAGKDDPRVLYALPLAAAPGFQGKVVLRGLKLDDVTDVKAAHPGAKVKLVGKPKKAAVPMGYAAEKAGDTEAEIELELARDFADDHLTLTTVSPKGTSDHFRFAVDAAPGVAEKEPNDEFKGAQEVVLPASVHGTIRQVHDIDLYRIVGKAGARFHVEVKAARLGAPTDAFVVVYDADKRIVDSADDTDGGSDPVLDFKLPRDGVYFVSVTEAQDSGGLMFAYRLLIRRKE
jgi:hypothetical protein